MTEPGPITDDEVLLRHIPGGTLWQAPGPRITSANFRLRSDQGETGVSVNRLGLTSPQRLLELVGGSVEAGSRVAEVRVGDVLPAAVPERGPAALEPAPLPDGPPRRQCREHDQGGQEEPPGLRTLPHRVAAHPGIPLRES